MVTLVSNGDRVRGPAWRRARSDAKAPDGGAEATDRPDREVTSSAARAPYGWPAVQMRVTFNQDGQPMLTSFAPDADNS